MNHDRHNSGARHLNAIRRRGSRLDLWILVSHDETGSFHNKRAFRGRYLLPGLVAGTAARSGGNLSAGKVSTFISARLINGQPKSGLVVPLRSTRTPTATTFPPCARTISIVSW